MPKSKKQNNITEEKKMAWRTPVKLPTIVVEDEPMKSFYTSSNEQSAVPQNKSITTESEVQNLKNEPSKEKISRSPENSVPTTLESDSKITKTNQTASTTQEAEAGNQRITGKKTENDSVRFGEAAFLRLLKTERMDFYSLAEILRGSSMALYCILYTESLEKGENRCQIRQSELMMRAGINNPATLYKQERWLTVLGLISKSVRPGNHSGASYEVRPLEILPLPNYILNQFDGYLTELITWQTINPKTKQL